uniref:Odorant binding protein n=1 Tax=Athetis dissimilis TaxID=1737331 RepID=A0A4D6QBH7_ATHDI|nr:odorant binding protein [Athetis dissimilis]
MQDFHVTPDDINRAAETGDPNIIPPCFNGCVFKKSGFINEKGEYDLDSGMAYLRPQVKDEEQYNALKEVATECTRKDEVSDGDAGCERGGKLSACFLQNKSTVKV